MFRWAPYVFVRITLFFLAGILWGIYFPDSLNEGLAQALLVFLAIAYCAFWCLQRKGLYFFPCGGIGLLFLLLVGYTLVLLRTDSRSQQHFLHEKQALVAYKTVINSFSQEKDKSWKVEALIPEIRTAHGWKRSDGKIILYFSKKDFEKAPSYGDVFLIQGSPMLLSEPANPGEFDYKRFLSYRKIYHQDFLREGQVFYLAHQPSSWFMHRALQARSWSMKQLHPTVEGKQEQAIASALVLGITDGLDNELLQAYSATGAMHVLAVSGLHVGIIYALLLLFLKPIAKRKGGKWTIAIVSLVVLWIYAFVTGLSPSVLRAVTMFSFVALSRPINRNTNIYNTLSLSAFCLLLYEPYLIMSVGFQLSYAAVLGIVYLQRFLYQWWVAPTWLLDKIWQITTVSIAAQLATVSLGLLYFHQFPVYFIFSNLLVIPASFAVLVLGLVALLVSAVAPLAAGVGQLLTWSIQFMNTSVRTVEELPFSLLDNLYITTLQAWLLMLLVASFVLLFQYKRFQFLVLAFVFMGWLSIDQWIHYVQVVNKKELFIYRVPGHQAIDFMATGTAHFVADSSLHTDEEKIRFHIRPNRLRKEVKGEVFSEMENVRQVSFGCKLIAWEEKTILLIEAKEAILPSIHVDYLVISNDAITLQALQKKIIFEKLIVDSSNSFYFADKLMKEAERMDIRAHSVLHQGYFSQRL